MKQFSLILTLIVVILWQDGGGTEQRTGTQSDLFRSMESFIVTSLNDNVENYLSTYNALKVSYRLPQGMHVSVVVDGTILVDRNELALRCEGTSSVCIVNVMLVFELPVGVYVDPYELKSRHEYMWENVNVHINRSSLPHLSGEVFTSDAQPFTLAVELLSVPIQPSTPHSNKLVGKFSLHLPIHLRYSSKLVFGKSSDTSSNCCLGERYNVLVSTIPMPQVFVGNSYSWAPGVAFSTWSANETPLQDIYVRGLGDIDMEQSSLLHERPKYTQSRTIRVSENDVFDMFSLLYSPLNSINSFQNMLSEAEALTQVKEYPRDICHVDQKLNVCIYLPGDEGMNIDVLIPVPSREHFLVVFTVTLLTVLFSTVLISHSLLVPPAH